jgi:hypothetical protein
MLPKMDTYINATEQLRYWSCFDPEDPLKSDGDPQKRTATTVKPTAMGDSPRFSVARQSTSPMHASPFLGPGVQHRLAYSGAEVRAAALTRRNGEAVLLKLFTGDEKREEDVPDAPPQEGAQAVQPAENIPSIAAQTPARAERRARGMFSW